MQHHIFSIQDSVFKYSIINLIVSCKKIEKSLGPVTSCYISGNNASFPPHMKLFKNLKFNREDGVELDKTTIWNRN
jgi:hypothetical protein